MNKLNKIISEVLRINESKITPEIAIHEVSTWNSLTHIELVVAMEEAFNIQLEEEDIVAMRSVEAIREVLKRRGVLAGAP